MQIRAEQIATHLKQQCLPVYLIAGDEPLQAMEAADVIRQAAYQRGFTERDVLTVDPQFDWGMLHEASTALSLFVQQKMLDLHVPSCKPGQAGSKALQQYCKAPPSDTLLLIRVAGRLERGCKSSAWFKALDKVGGVVQVWELNPAQTLAWVARRVKQAGLQADQDAIRFITERVEGNLLAAVQEIEKLKLLFAGKSLTADKVSAAVADSSRFSIFDLGDAVLSNDQSRIRHVVQILREEGTALPLVLWSLSDVLRQLHEGHTQTRRRQPLQDLLRRMPRTRQNVYQQALRRQQQGRDWAALFLQVSRLEQHSKGVGEDASSHPQRLWDEVLNTALSIAH